ncbi:hypothetical protein HPP92_006578 [Vanilla planifolia]|uniref:Uncharacterized protein n=1 Tax=Vanilla planifolia TaxID=51239 RepID=A0A835VAF4_VANPL|nr:hypothetical protein HPP92_006578 [Vanilla planifolia]
MARGRVCRDKDEPMIETPAELRSEINTPMNAESFGEFLPWITDQRAVILGILISGR